MLQISKTILQLSWERNQDDVIMNAFQQVAVDNNRESDLKLGKWVKTMQNTLRYLIEQVAILEPKIKTMVKSFERIFWKLEQQSNII